MIKSRSHISSSIALSGPCRRVLECLIEQDGLSPIGPLADGVGSHPNTVREHLAVLLEAGLVTRERATPSGRGRPPWHYRATALALTHDTSYEGLAVALADQLKRMSADPHSAAIEAGEHWSSEIVDPNLPPSPDGDGVRRRVLSMLDELGFDPDPVPVAGRMRLRACPMIGAAEREPDVVCSVHLGLVRGIVKNAGGDPDSTELLPFFDPDACHLGLG